MGLGWVVGWYFFLFQVDWVGLIMEKLSPQSSLIVRIKISQFSYKSIFLIKKIK